MNVLGYPFLGTPEDHDDAQSVEISLFDTRMISF